jgi:hypothetical protein
MEPMVEVAKEDSGRAGWERRGARCVDSSEEGEWE